jgi:hypothetical protein
MPPMDPEGAADSMTPDRDWLVSWLAEHDAACPVCAYALRGLRADRCPECGGTLSLGVTSDQLAHGPWLVGIISFALGLGFDGVMSVIMTSVLFLEPPRSHAEFRMAAAMISGFVVLGGACLLGVIAISRRRSAWNRMGRVRQRWVAGAIFAGVGLLHAAFGLFLATTLS